MKKIINYFLRGFLKLMPLITFPKINVKIYRKLGYNVDLTARIYSSVQILGKIDVVIGANTFIGHQSIITGGLAKVIIGNNCDISDRVSIVCGSHLIDSTGNRSAGKGIGKDIIIEDGVWIGFGAIILPGVQIGEKAIIGAGCLVNRDVPERTIVVGNPMRIIKTI